MSKAFTPKKSQKIYLFFLMALLFCFGYGISLEGLTATTSTRIKERKFPRREQDLTTRPTISPAMTLNILYDKRRSLLGNVLSFILVDEFEIEKVVLVKGAELLRSSYNHRLRLEKRS